MPPWRYFAGCTSEIPSTPISTRPWATASEKLIEQYAAKENYAAARILVRQSGGPIPRTIRSRASGRSQLKQRAGKLLDDARDALRSREIPRGGPVLADAWRSSGPGCRKWRS